MSKKAKTPTKVPPVELPKLLTNIELKVSRRATNGIPLKGTVVRHVTVEGNSQAFLYQPENTTAPAARQLCLWVANYAGREATWVLNANKRLFVVDAILTTP